MIRLPRDRRRGHAHFVERILAEEFVLSPGLNNEGVAVFAQAEYLAVVSPWRRGESAGRRVDALLAVNSLPVLASWAVKKPRSRSV